MIPAPPHFHPSYAVHISPTWRVSGHCRWHARNYWITEGHELQSIIGMLYDFDPDRIDFQDPDLATERFDVAMVPPKDIREEAMQEAIRTALQRELGLLLIQGVWRKDVYIVTSPDGPRAALQEETENTGTTIHMGGGGISMRSGTIAEFCSALEHDLDRPVIDETQLKGRYSVQVRRGHKPKDQFFEQLNNELGLLVSHGERDVKMLIVRRR